MVATDRLFQGSTALQFATPRLRYPEPGNLLSILKSFLFLSALKLPGGTVILYSGTEDVVLKLL